MGHGSRFARPLAGAAVGRKVSVQWAATYAYVSEKLAGTEAAGEPDTIKKSYGLVEALFRVGKGARFRS
jgi:hypothetical protein